MSKASKTYGEKEGILLHRTNSCTPGKNGVVERLHVTLLERARSMLSTAGLSQKFWAEAVNTVAYLMN